MRPHLLLMGLNGALLLGGGAWWWSQQATTDALRQELAGLRERADEVAKLQAENRRLAAQQVPVEERERLRADHEALARMKAELDSLDRRAQARLSEPGPAGGRTERVRGDPPAPAGAGPMVPPGEWKNAGGATPEAAFETMVWAAAGGDLARLAEMQYLTPQGKKLAAAMLAELPEGTRAAAATPEQVVALFTAKDAPMGGMQVTKSQIREDENTGVVWLRLKAEDGKIKESVFYTIRENGTWRVAVPDAAVAAYAARLKSAPAK